MPIPPFIIQFFAKYLMQILLVIAIIGGYFVWEKHQQSIGEERALAKVEKTGKEFLQKKILEIGEINDQQHKLKDEALDHYRTRNATLDDDVSRLQNRACRSGNSVSRGVQNREAAQERDVGPDRQVFREAISLLNECYLEIESIPTK